MGYDLIIKENGYVDTDALLAELKKTVEHLQEARTIMSDISNSLGADVNNNKPDRQDTGKIIDPLEVIRLCEVFGNEVHLPKIQFNKKVYADVKKLLENSGGSWVGGKTQAFVFPFNPERVISELKAGNKINIQQDYQFFETPDDISDWMVSLSGIKEGCSILEPSAGRGSIIRAIHRVCPNTVVDCFELMPENRDFLLCMNGINLIGFDFLTEPCNRKYDAIIANPPFSGNQDMMHVMRMYDCLSNDGILLAITSRGYTFRNDKKAIEFREWLASVDAKQYRIEKGRFKDSGTAIEANLLKIRK